MSQSVIAWLSTITAGDYLAAIVAAICGAIIPTLLWRLNAREVAKLQAAEKAEIAIVAWTEHVSLLKLNEDSPTLPHRFSVSVGSREIKELHLVSFRIVNTGPRDVVVPIELIMDLGPDVEVLQARVGNGKPSLFESACAFGKRESMEGPFGLRLPHLNRSDTAEVHFWATGPGKPEMACVHPGVNAKAIPQKALPPPELSGSQSPIALLATPGLSPFAAPMLLYLALWQILRNRGRDNF